MTMDLWFEFKPLSEWPGARTKSTKRAAFRADYGKTCRELLREIALLGGTDPIIEAECDGDAINIRTGMLKSTARLRGQGVVVSFDSKFGPLRYPCDNYDQWQQNLRAIVLYMQNQRANARYGVGRVEQIYRGYQALPESIAAAEWATVEDAIRFLMAIVGWVKPPQNGEINDLYRLAARHEHPDAGGSDDRMAKVNRARDFIEGSKGR